MDFTVNANENVKVKLTDFGISVLKERHDELNNFMKQQGGKGLEKFELRLDEEGFYRTQLWSLMNEFGHVMSMGYEVPFNLNIIITNGEPITE